MVKKSLNLLLFIFVLNLGISPLMAQKTFAHSVGSEILVGSTSLSYLVTYSPRINFLKISESKTLSLGTHLGGGYVSDDLVFSSGNILAYQVPLLLEYNVGAGATDDNDLGFGYFFGGGYGLIKHRFIDFNAPSKGALLDAGIRFTYFATLMELRSFVFFDTANSNAKVFSVSFSITMEGARFGEAESIESRRTRTSY